MREYFRVATRAEHMPPRKQLVAKLAEVVDLTVEYDPDLPVLVRDRRVPGLEVDDREAVLRDRAEITAEVAESVGTAVMQQP